MTCELEASIAWLLFVGEDKLDIGDDDDAVVVSFEAIDDKTLLNGKVNSGWKEEGSGK